MIRLSFITALLLGPFMCAQADRISLTDARSLALGGTGVAMGGMNGALNNPALLAYKHEFNEWGTTFPTVGAQQPYPREFKDSFNEFQTLQNKQSRDQLIGKSHNETLYTAIIGAVPNTVLGGSLYLSGYEYKSISVKEGNDSFDPQQTIVNSKIEKRSVLVIEHGYSVAKVLNEQARGTHSFSFGISPKIILLQAQKEQQTIDIADLKLNYNGSGTTSAFNVDIGLLQELGRYTIGLFVKNIIPVEVKYNNKGNESTEEKFILYPEFRSGVAYQKRSLAWELDVGVLANNGILFDAWSVYSALGIEYSPAKFLHFRIGYRQELQPTYTGKGSFGLGIGHNYHIDLAVFGGEYDAGAGIDIGLNF